MNEINNIMIVQSLIVNLSADVLQMTNQETLFVEKSRELKSREI